MRFAITRLMSAATFAACVAMPAAWAGEINFWVTEPLKAKAEQALSSS